MFRKSVLYYSGATMAAFASFAWSATIFFSADPINALYLKILPYPLNPHGGFLFIFLAIFLTKKGNTSTHLEHGRPGNGFIPMSRTWKLVNAIGISICSLLALAFIVKICLPGQAVFTN